jgi:D-alanine-D-alanine ligase
VKKIGVFFGGRSAEHEVSVITGMQIIENIDKTKYEVVPIYVSKEGKWLTGDSLLDFKNYKDGKFKDTKEIILSPNYKDNNVYAHPEMVRK